jgi:hypothetical protein
VMRSFPWAVLTHSQTLAPMSYRPFTPDCVVPTRAGPMPRLILVERSRAKEPLINLAITSVFGGQCDHGQMPATVDRFPCYFRGRNGYLVPFGTQFTCQA